MKERLRIEHIVPYLPYELKMSVNSELYPNPVLIGLKSIYAYMSYYGTGLAFEINKTKPYLRPLSDLVEEIEHNGEGLTPLHRLFEMIPKNNYIDYKGECNIPKYQIDDGWNHCISYTDNIQEVCLSYGCESFWLMVDADVCLLDNQLGMFEKLFEWHFDVFGLIDKGVAIDVNTID